jgi:glycerol 3-phosphatase-2
MRERGKEVLFLTNDPRSSREQYAEKLRGLGVDCDRSEVLTAGAATAEHVARQAGAPGGSAFVIGTPALKEEVAAVGLAVTDGDDGSEADVVVVGGHDGFDYTELRIASQAVRRGARFYATGRDATFPMPGGSWPAAGSILAAVETASGRRAHVVGKPEPDMFRIARDLIPEARRCLVVGDRLDSDIAGGRRAGLATALVLTGSTTEEEAASADPAPDFVIPDLRALVVPGMD